MLLLKKNIIKKGQVDENDIIELDISDNNNRKYKVEVIWNSVFYAKELAVYLLKLY